MNKIAFEDRVMVLLCLGSLGLTVLLYYPGSLTEDSLWQLYQARHGFADDGNPPVMTLVWRFVDRYIISGQRGMFLLIAVMYWTGLTLLVTSLTKSLLLRIGGFLSVGFFPPVFGLLAAVWKDVFMLASFCLSLGLYLTWSTKRKCNGKSSASLLIASFALLLMCLLTRHNAVFIVLPILLFYLFGIFNAGARSAARITSYLALGALLMVGVIVLQSTIYKRAVSQKTHLWTYFMVYDLVGIEVKDSSYRISPILRDKIIKPGILLADYYEPKAMFTLLSGRPGPPPLPSPLVTIPVCDEETQRNLRKEWAEAVLSHPIGYLRHRIGFLSYFVGWNDWSKDDKFFAPIILGVSLDDQYIWGRDKSLAFNPHTVQLFWYHQVLNRLLNKATFFYRVYLYCVVLLLLLGVGIYWAIHRNDWTLAALTSSGLLNVANFTLLAGSPDFRYNLFTISVCTIAAFYFVATVHNERHKGDSGNGLQIEVP